jgi:hypothetical protein
VFETRLLRRIFGPKRDEVIEKWRRLHNEEHNDLYSSQNIIREIKARRMRWAGHVECMDEGRIAYRILVEKLREGEHLRNPDVDGMILLEWIFKKWDGGMDGIDVAQDRDRCRALVNAVTNFGFHKMREFLD